MGASLRALVGQAVPAWRSRFPAHLLNELELLDHPSIVVRPNEASEQLEMVHHVAGRCYRLEISASSRYPAEAATVKFEEQDAGAPCSQKQVRLQTWQEQLCEVARDASEHGRGCLEAVASLLVCMGQDLQEFEPQGDSCGSRKSVELSTSVDLTDSLDEAADLVECVEPTEKTWYLDLVPLTHQKGFHVCLGSVSKPQEVTMGRLPSSQMLLEHDSCSQQQVSFQLNPHEPQQLHAHIRSSQPMVLASHWWEPGQRVVLKSGDTMAFPCYNDGPNRRDRLMLLAWMVQIRDSKKSHMEAALGPKLVPLTREGPAVPVLSDTCLGPAPNFAIWTPRCVADRHGAVATVDREGDLRVLVGRIFVNLEGFDAGAQVRLRFGDVLSWGAHVLSRRRNCFAAFTSDKVQTLPRLPTPCSAVAGPDSLTLTVKETANLPMPSQTVPRQLEEVAAAPRRSVPEKAVCLPGSKIWDGEEGPASQDCAESSSQMRDLEAAEPASGEGSESVAMDVVENSAENTSACRDGSIDSSPVVQASDSQLSMGSMGQLSHWVERAMGMTSEGEQMDSMADESQETSRKRSQDDVSEADLAESAPRRIRYL